jgi:phage repressor protein C with HTH and peptisase S24 domain
MICDIRQDLFSAKPAIISRMAVKNRDPLGLKARLNAIGASQKDLADALGISYDATHRMVSGARKKLSAEEERKIARFFSEHGSPGGASSDGGLVPYDGSAFQTQPGRIPLYGFTGGPDTPGRLEAGAIVDQIERHPAQKGRVEAFAVEVWRESMAPRHFPGELVYCVRDKWPAPGQDCLIELKDGQVFLKQYVGLKDGMMQTRQYNPDQIRTFPHDKVKALHAVVR